ncbi:MAG: hypothetical protein VB144_15170 [Clostridia bacterium]|nr:hypothetical protein [Clostridia bacterium]
MRVSRVGFAVLVCAIAVLIAAGPGRCAEVVVSPVERLMNMENLLFGSAQEGSIVGRLEAIERLVFGELSAGTLPDRLNQCWNFIQGDRAGGMNIKFKLRAIQWTMFGAISDGPIVPCLADLETRLLGQQAPGSVGSRLDALMGLTMAGGKPEVGYALLPKGILVKVKLTTGVSSVKSRPGDVIGFEVVQDAICEGKLVIAAGAGVPAKIVETVRPTKTGVRARVDFEIGPVEGMDSAAVNLGVDQAAMAANSSVPMTIGDAPRKFGIMGKEGALGGVFTPNEELELAAGAVFFLSVMQTSKILGLVVPASK